MHVHADSFLRFRKEIFINIQKSTLYWYIIVIIVAFHLRNNKL